MPRPPRRRKITSTSAHAASGSRELVWMEMEPLLSAERRRCEKTAADLERIAAELEKVRTGWEPAFSRWFHRLFDKKVTRVRELELRSSELRDLISAVEYEAFVSGCSMGAAHARVERMRQAPARKESPDFDRLARRSFGEFYDAGKLEPDEAEALFEEFKHEFREEILGQPNAQEDARESHTHRHRPPQSRADVSATPDPEGGRRKKLYRNLARRLHPDSNPNLTHRERELWHEVQTAYDTRNLEALETLTALTEGEGAAGYLKIRSISRLRAILTELQSKLRAARKTVRELAKQPFWRFDEVESDPLRIRELTKRMESELNASIRGLETEVLEDESYVESWSHRSKSRRR